MNAFVTGANGLLGSNLVRALRWEGHQVTALLPPPEAGTQQLQSSDAGIRYVFGSIDRPSRWLSALDRTEVLFHAASPSPGVSVMDSDQDRWPVASFTTGVLLGPGDVSSTALGRWILEFLRTGNIGPAFGGACVVDARDVAIAMMTAAERRAEGEFVLAGHYVEYSEVLQILQDVTGRKARPHGRVLIREGRPAGSTRAIDRLSVTFRSVEDSIRDVVAWYSPRHTADLVA